MPTNNRQKRVAELIHRELAKIILSEPQDPIFKQITITDTKVSADLSVAKIFFTTFDESTSDKALVAIDNETKKLRYSLAKKLNLRITPQLKFIYDKSIAQGKKLHALIDMAIASDKRETSSSDDNEND
jgi:ribosome-binding factor A